MDHFNKYKIPAINAFLKLGLSIIPTREDKKPAITSWKHLQEKQMTEDEANKAFDRSDVKGIGIICGKVSGNLEAIDVDCKHDHTGNLWPHLKTLIEDNLPDLFPQFVITTTVNKGYHLLYRCETIDKNLKLASNEDNTTLIETRGEGGYVIEAPTNGYKFIQNKSKDIPTITPKERECLFTICKSFDLQPVKNESYGLAIDSTLLSPFEDYNSKADVISLLEKHGWTKTKETGVHVHLKRPGNSTHASSANYHTNMRLFYVFSTSTQFDACRAYNPVQVYAKLECNDDLSEASKKLYEAGYGDRRPQKETKTPINKKALPSTGLLPIEGMPPAIQNFINIHADTYATPRDYWAASVIMATALGIGDKIQLNTKYQNVPILWTNIIGDVSSGKTEAQNICLKPFEKMDSASITQFKKDYQQYEQIIDMSLKERREEGIEIISEPRCFQYIAKDATPEAMAMVHSVNNRGLIIHRDELKGMLDDFNRYTKSGEQSVLLSSYNQISMTINRKGGGINSVIDIPKPVILIFGGMQPEMIPQFGGDNRKENGFLARFCHIWPDHTKKPHYTKGFVPESYFGEWTEYITNLTKIEEQFNITLSDEAETIYEEWYNQNCDISDNEESGYLKGVYGKLDIMVLRMAIVLFGMNHYQEWSHYPQIQASEMNASIAINEYFRNTGLKVYQALFGQQKQFNKKDIIKYLAATTKHSQTQIAQITGTSQQYVNKVLKE